MMVKNSWKANGRQSHLIYTSIWAPDETCLQAPPGVAPSSNHTASASCSWVPSHLISPCLTFPDRWAVPQKQSEKRGFLRPPEWVSWKEPL